MRKLAALALTVLAFLGAAETQAAEHRIQVGVLSCEAEPGLGLIIGSSKDMACVFRRSGYRAEYYQGNISKLGLDLGITQRTHLEWLVFAAADTRIGRKSLAGHYVGGSAEATLGVGLGANWLIGGSRRSFALQPISVTAQTGLNVSFAFAGLTLR